MYYAGIRPVATRQQQKLVTVNEVMIMFTNYHLICLTEFVDIKLHWDVAKSLKYTVMSTMALNFLVMFYNITKRGIRKYKIDKSKVIWKEHLKNITELRINKYN